MDNDINDIMTLLAPISDDLLKMPESTKQEIISLINQKSLSKEISSPIYYSYKEETFSTKEETYFVLYPNGTIKHVISSEEDDGYNFSSYQSKSFGIYNLNENCLQITLINYKSDKGGWLVRKFDETFERNLAANNFRDSQGRSFTL